MRNFGAYIWNFIGKFGSQLLWLATTMVLARFLEPDEFGIIGVLSLIFMVANTLTESGLGGALVIEKEIKDDDCATIFSFNVIISISIYLIIFFSADAIETFYNVENLAKITRTLGLVFIINAWGIVPRTILCHQLKFKEMCILTLSNVIFSSVISVILAWQNFGVYALVAYQIIYAIINAIGFIILSKYKFPIMFRLSNFKRLFNFGFFTTITGVVDTLYENMMAAIFGKFFSVAQAGYLSQAKKIEEATSLSLLATVNNTSFPLLSKLKDDIQAFRAEADNIRNTIPLLIFPILVTISVFSKEVTILLYGEKWLEASGYLAILVFAGIFMIIDAITRNFIKSLGYVNLLFKATLIKRIAGCLIIAIAGVVSLEFILYGYVLSAMIGIIFNCVVYSKIINQSIFNDIISTFSKTISLLPLYLIIFVIYHISPSLPLKIFFAGVILAIYYFFYLPKKGINIYNKIHSMVRR